MLVRNPLYSGPWESNPQNPASPNYDPEAAWNAYAAPYAGNPYSEEMISQADYDRIGLNSSSPWWAKALKPITDPITGFLKEHGKTIAIATIIAAGGYAVALESGMITGMTAAEAAAADASVAAAGGTEAAVAAVAPASMEVTTVGMEVASQAGATVGAGAASPNLLSAGQYVGGYGAAGGGAATAGGAVASASMAEAYIKGGSALLGGALNYLGMRETNAANRALNEQAMAAQEKARQEEMELRREQMAIQQGQFNQQFGFGQQRAANQDQLALGQQQNFQYGLGGRLAAPGQRIDMKLPQLKGYGGPPPQMAQAGAEQQTDRKLQLVEQTTKKYG